MKCVLVMGSFVYGGAERVMCSLANYFIGSGNEVVLVTITHAPETYPLNNKIKRINGLNWKNQLDGVLKLRKVFIDEKPDVVITFIAHINIASLLAGLWLKVPIIISERNDPAHSATTSLRRILRKVTYQRAKAIVCQTQDSKEYFSEKIQQKVDIIPNPLYLAEDNVDFDQRDNEIVSVGRFVPQKRHEVTIRALSKLKDEFDYRLTIYGNGDDGEKERLQDLVDKLGLTGRVILHDAVSDLHKRIKYAKAFILMSEYEGMPNALMEAMGLGLVCFCSDCPCGGPKFLIKDEENGFLIKVDDEKMLVERLREALTDNDKMHKISLAAQDVRIRLDPEQIWKQWGALVSKVTLS